MLWKYEKRLNSRLINLLMWKKNKKQQKQNKPAPKVWKFMKKWIKQIKKDFNL